MIQLKDNEINEIACHEIKLSGNGVNSAKFIIRIDDFKNHRGLFLYF